MQDLNNKNYKTLLRIIKEDLNVQRYSIFMDVKIQLDLFFVGAPGGSIS